MATYICEHCSDSFERRGAKPGRFCSRVCKGEWQRTQKPVSREWLYQQYIVEALDTSEIGRIVHCDPKSVWNWLQDFGIPTRGRGTDIRQQFKPGESAWRGQHHTQATKDKLRQHRIDDGRVPYLKNGVHHLKGKRGADTPNWKGGVTPERQAFYSTTEWASAVKAVWHRADARCERCLLDHRTIDRTQRFHIHHVVSFAMEALRCEVTNLALLCDKCHRWVHSRQNKEGLFLASDASIKRTEMDGFSTTGTR